MKEQLLKLQEVFTKAKGISIELGAIDDLVKEDKEGRKLIEALATEQGEVDEKYTDIKNLVRKYNKLNKDYRGSVKKGKATLKNLMSNIETVQKGLKELGINPSEVSELKSAMRSSEVLRGRSNDAYNYPDVNL